LGVLSADEVERTACGSAVAPKVIAEISDVLPDFEPR
jgi:hypothetical protein